MKYAIITKNKVYESEPEEIYKEQYEKKKIFGLSDEKEYVCHFFDSAFFDESTEAMYLEDAIERLAIKDGVDMVQFDNGNLGFIAYYSGEENGFEIIG